MAHKITGRNMFFLYMYIIHVSFALLLKHGGNGSIVIAAGLLHFNPYCRGTSVVWWPGHACLDIGPPHVTVPPIPIVLHGTIPRYRGTSYFV